MRALRVRDYPFVFAGLTIALLIFAVVWTAPWPQLCQAQPNDHTQPNHTYTNQSLPIGAVTGQPSSGQTQSECNEKSNSDWWGPRIGVATVLVTALQLLLFYWQLVAMRAGVKDAADAAKAATCQANIAQRTFEKLERPYLYVTGVEGFNVESGTELDDMPFVRFRIVNHGKIPASVDEILIVNESTPSLAPGLGLLDLDGLIARNRIFGAGENRGDRSIVPSQGNLPKETRIKWRIPEAKDGQSGIEAKLPDGETFFFRVILRYKGSFTKGHETSACWRLEGGSTFEPFGGDEFNYVR